MPQDENVFGGTFGKVRKVTIRGVASIREWIEFAGKTMKVEKNKEKRLQRLAEALACRSPWSDQAPIFEHKDVRVILHVVERRVLDEYDGI